MPVRKTPWFGRYSLGFMSVGVNTVPPLILSLIVDLLSARTGSAARWTFLQHSRFEASAQFEEFALCRLLSHPRRYAGLAAASYARQPQSSGGMPKCRLSRGSRR